jgi:hypothetical protein
LHDRQFADFAPFPKTFREAEQPPRHRRGAGHSVDLSDACAVTRLDLTSGLLNAVVAGIENRLQFSLRRTVANVVFRSDSNGLEEWAGGLRRWS